MNPLLITILLLLVPGLVLADGSLSFTPPATDYSVVFLGNLFGVVDGVLSGTGSQIMGSMFAVLNAAILALGGIVIIYTLIVATMNTAHEGQMLGQKWSSIWIPIRSTIGLALLIPKASGYCLMQIFVMWIVIQGVGAADKVWGAALSYLNRGGVIIQAQQTGASDVITDPNVYVNGGQISATSKEIIHGASVILEGQVCMLALQRILETNRQALLDAKSKDKAGACAAPNLSPAMDGFCKTSVPDFIGTVNLVGIQSRNPGAPSWSVNMPNFDQNSIYSNLNGICGTITWNNLDTLDQTLGDKLLPYRRGTNAQTEAYKAGAKAYANHVSQFTQLILDKGNGSATSEALALKYQQDSGINNVGFGEIDGPILDANGQAFKDSNGNDITDPSKLSAAQRAAAPRAEPTPGSNTKLGNNTLNSEEAATTLMSRAIAIQQMYVNLSSVAQRIVSNDPVLSGKQGDKNYATTAKIQFGIPYKADGTPCETYNQNCVLWGQAGGTSGGGVLLNGTELNSAVADYNGIMMPAINLSKMNARGANQNTSTKFITRAENQGWIMAGAYFFNLLDIQGSAVTNRNLVDKNTGLAGSSFNFSADLSTAQSHYFVNGWCQGGGVLSNLCPWLSGDITKAQHIADLLGVTTSAVPDIKQTMKALSTSTVYSFINNALMLKSAEQPGVKSLTFANSINFSINTDLYRLKRQSFECGEVTPYYTICLGRIMGDVFYNIMLVTIYNAFLDIFGEIINSVVLSFLMVPLEGMANIFQRGIEIMGEPGVNPVVALAKMGNHYINFAGNLWMMLLNMAVSSSLILWFGIFIFAMMSLAMPLVIAWVGVMVSVGFTTSYYVPLLPYMIFTFGALGWMISVIEAMVAAPIVALGVTHPEGHDAFGKGEAAIMILVNIFLRPAMMIIGYISAIALTYVGVWILNAGYDQAVSFMQADKTGDLDGLLTMKDVLTPSAGTGIGGVAYTDWAGIYAFFFSILTYTTVYLTIVQKSFTLITYLPDKVLRWIGGSPESIGQESAGWGDEVKSKHGEAGKDTHTASNQLGKSLGGYGAKAVKSVTGAGEKAGGGTDMSAQGNATPSKSGKGAPMGK